MTNDLIVDENRLDQFIDTTTAAVHWLARTYETSERWKKEAVDCYFAARGISDLARCELANRLRSYFVADKPEAEDVRVWNKGHTEIVTIHVTPPKISETNATYVDWLYVADYFLLCCGTTRDDIDDANTSRRGSHKPLRQSYELRRLVMAAIKLLEESPNLSDAELLAAIKKQEGEESAASMVTVKEAKRWVKAGEKPTTPIEPPEPAEMGRYESLYF